MTNSELRKRKNKEHNGISTSRMPKKSSKSPESQIYRSLLCLIASASILTIFIILYTDQIPWHIGHQAIDHFAKQFGYEKLSHVVVIDAGSTGSRVLAFTYHQTYLGGNLVLDKELFKYTKPGLSSFASDPQKGAQTIGKLLDLAKQEIPEKYWSQTPLILKATAGLRLLPTHQAENLLNAVRVLFQESPFLTNENSVEIMDGVDEGIFSWFTVNFLLEKFNGNPGNTVAALDLGGGSTQVTFSALTPASLKETEHISQAVSPSGNISVYTHSYLGLGLMAARKEILTWNQKDQSKNISSLCVNHIIKDKKFHYGGVDYFVSGLKEGYPTSKTLENDITVGSKYPIVSFKECQKLVENYVATKAKHPEELSSKTIFAFSYYFDRAAEAGLIEESTGGRVVVDDFQKAAETACHSANADQPFMCLDLTFIWVLLEKGLGLGNKTNIYLYKKIRGHEISWALGAGYDLLKS